MMNGLDKIKVDTGNKPYYIHYQDNFEPLDIILKQHGYEEDTRITIITDSNVGPLYEDELKRALKSFKEVSTFTFEAGEESKTLETVTQAYDHLIEHKRDRKSVVLALGGGVVGDMAGFVASTYMRGLTYIQIPTTLLAQLDSSVGGKTGFDYRGYKNMIGCFYQPQLVYMNLSTLKTLPPREFSAGMAEAIKHGFIMDKNYLDFMNLNHEAILGLHLSQLTLLVQGSCKIKTSVVSQDEKELGLREILNFGHTIGHAVESSLGFTLLHGECVSIGLVAALYLSHRHGYITEETLKDYEEMLENYHLPIKAPNLNVDKVYDALYHDKKVKNGKLQFVLLKKVGQPLQHVEVEPELIKESISYVLVK